MPDEPTDDHLRAMSRVFGPETWSVYELLDRSLEPRGPETLLALGADGLSRDSRILDVGCRDATHLTELVLATGATGVGVEPLRHLLDQARATVREAGLDDRIELVQGEMSHIPFPDCSFDLVWCRDVIEVVADLDAGVAEMARVLHPDGHLIVFTVLATDRLEPKEAQMLLDQNLAVVASNLSEKNLEATFRRAGLVVVDRDEIGTEWREHAEERYQPASKALLQLSRLRRQRDRIVERAGEDVYGHVESNLHWLVYQFLGKLRPTIYVLRRPLG